MELTALLPLLRSHGVKSFKNQGLEIEFESAGIPPKASEPIAETGKLVDVPEPSNMPPDLKADDTMNYDKILNWSATPDVEPGEALPLTGDAPIEGAA